MKEFKGNELARQVMELVKPYTCFPVILVETQAKKIGKDLDRLQASDMTALADAIEKAVTAFGNPEKGREAKQKLMQLA